MITLAENINTVNSIEKINLLKDQYFKDLSENKLKLDTIKLTYQVLATVYKVEKDFTFLNDGFHQNLIDYSEFKFDRMKVLGKGGCQLIYE